MRIDLCASIYIIYLSSDKQTVAEMTFRCQTFKAEPCSSLAKLQQLAFGQNAIQNNIGAGSTSESPTMVLADTADMTSW